MLPRLTWHRHNKSGAVYWVECVANLDADPDRQDEYPVTVVYKNLDGVIWSRPIDKWRGSFTEITSDQACK